jgi:hypothetical protein
MDEDNEALVHLKTQDVVLHATCRQPGRKGPQRRIQTRLTTMAQ